VSDHVRSKSLVIPRGAARLTAAETLRLSLEILRAYVLVRWWLLRSDVPGAAESARSGRPHIGLEDGPIPVSTAVRLGRAVQRTLGSLPFDSRCLVRSLVLRRILARRGAESTVVLAARSRPKFEAHAWVEYDDVPVLPTGEGFHRLTEI
jgi:Transglutaminase-like superfamily